MYFEKCCKEAEKKIKDSDKQYTRDTAMCFITTALVYSILALASAVKENKREE